MFGDVLLTGWVLVICLIFLFLLSVSRRPILISSGFLWLLSLLEVGQPPLLLLGRENRVAVNGLERGSREALLRCKVHPRDPVEEFPDDGQCSRLCINDVFQGFPRHGNRRLLNHTLLQSVADASFPSRRVDPFVGYGSCPPKRFDRVNSRAFPGTPHVL